MTESVVKWDSITDRIFIWVILRLEGKYLYPLFLCEMIEMEAFFMNRMRFAGWPGFVMKILICIDGLGLFYHSEDKSFYSLLMWIYERRLIFWHKRKSTLFKLQCFIVFFLDLVKFLLNFVLFEVRLVIIHLFYFLFLLYSIFTFLYTLFRLLLFLYF